MKSQKGITLVALVITIIVMLILVAVTITIAVNGGLFDYARNASKQTNEHMENEQALANGTVQVNGVQANEINDLVSHYTSTATDY